MLGLTEHAYRRWERGEVEPRAGQIISLADFYLITIDQLLTGVTEHGSAFVQTVAVKPGQRIVLNISGHMDSSSELPGTPEKKSKKPDKPKQNTTSEKQSTPSEQGGLLT